MARWCVIRTQMEGCSVADRVPGWYIDSVTEAVKQMTASARKLDSSVESLVQTVSDRSVPGMEDLRDQEYCTALATALAVAIKMLADSTIPTSFS